VTLKKGPARVARAGLKQRELELVRDIAEAFFNAGSPVEVYRLALARVTPAVNAAFSSVFLRDEAEPDLLRLVCANNWPQSSARYLGQMRIRVGRGPTGRAVAEGIAISAEDIVNDMSLREWWAPARELGFASLVSLPLETGGEAIGAVTFYYTEPHRFTEEERTLLDVIAKQLSRTADHASATQDLGEENTKLHERVAELERRVARSEAFERLKDEFLANMSHEFRTPLTSVLGYTYLMREGQAGAVTPDQRAALAKIDASATVLLNLIDDLLTLTELKLGRTDVIPEMTDAALLVRRALETAPQPSSRVRVRVEGDNRVPMQTDVDKVLKILENLLSNAIKFTSQGEIVVNVRARRQGADESVEWSVRDTGIGIAADALSGLFDEFRQVDGSSTRLYGGTGLGLALSLHLARLLGGDISVESEPGQGSTFTLRLPARRP